MAAAITALMTGRAYRTSGEIAAAIGPYDEFEQNREPHLRVMRKHRDAAYEIRRGRGERPARGRPAQLGRGGRARRAPRAPQRAGDGAGADRHDQLPDGLRHHRCRARLLARQDQGAGRRRHDDDRQPHGSARRFASSATPTRRSSRSRPTSTSTARSSARPPSRTSTCRCSTSRSASARSRTWATSR